MDGVQRGRCLWKNLKQRLRSKGIGLCGSSWSLGENNTFEEEEAEEQVGQIPTDAAGLAPPCMGRIPAPAESLGMSLATALAVERNLRPVGPCTPLKSLMGLFEEMDGEDPGSGAGGRGIDAVCCVCMERSKGAAFIPCGHTYCRVCSRELWLNRGSCPLCNRQITEILDIF
ncbi:hypothetical protein NMG60_11003156 [Bertholletia excelsa]